MLTGVHFLLVPPIWKGIQHVSRHVHNLVKLKYKVHIGYGVRNTMSNHFRHRRGGYLTGLGVVVKGIRSRRFLIRLIFGLKLVSIRNLIKIFQKW